MLVWVSLRSRILPSSSGPEGAARWPAPGRPACPTATGTRPGAPGPRTASPSRSRARPRWGWSGHPASARPVRSPLMSATNTGTPGGGELAGQQLERLGLAGARGARDQAVPVDHRQAHRDPQVARQLAVLHRRPERDARPGEGIARRSSAGGRRRPSAPVAPLARGRVGTPVGRVSPDRRVRLGADGQSSLGRGGFLGRGRPGMSRAASLSRRDSTRSGSMRSRTNARVVVLLDALAWRPPSTARPSGSARSGGGSRTRCRCRPGGR